MRVRAVEAFSTFLATARTPIKKFCSKDEKHLDHSHSHFLGMQLWADAIKCLSIGPLIMVARVRCAVLQIGIKIVL